MTGDRAEQDRSTPILTLFIAGDSPRSSRARHHLRQALQDRGLDDHAVEVIDALREPRTVLAHRIFATPTLTTRPPEESVLYGDLSNRPALDRFLDGVIRQD